MSSDGKTGEFSLIRALLARQNRSDDPSILVGPGDDGSVIRLGDQLLAVTVDAFKEDRHFSFDYATPTQVGFKALEASASDIVAMGGRPHWAWISLSIPQDAKQDLIEQVYDGLYQSADRLGVGIEGGETIVDYAGLGLSVTVLGLIASESDVCRRSDAKPGDLVCVTGGLGGSAAGMRLLQQGVRGFDELKVLHVTPTCRLDLQPQLARVANALIDISDGLSSELWHVAVASGVRLTIDLERIPLNAGLSEAAAELNTDPIKLALNGGEDFELLYTVSEWHESLPGSVIGEVSAGRGVFSIDSSENLVPLPAAGYNHLA